MTEIHILPLDVVIEAADDATVMGAAQALGYYWPTTCGGDGRCTTCACEVVDGGASLTPMGRAEQKSLVYERGEGVLKTPVRLACQARVIGGAPGIVRVTIRKPGVRPPLD